MIAGKAIDEIHSKCSQDWTYRDKIKAIRGQEGLEVLLTA